MDQGEESPMKQEKKSSKKKSMSAHQARVGVMYLTRQGIPVKIKKLTSRGVEVILTLLKKSMMLKRSTLLFPYDKSKVKKSTILHRLSAKKKTSTLARPAIQTSTRAKSLAIRQTLSPTQAQRGPKGPRSSSVSSVVDPMLFAAMYTREQINTALAQSEIGKTLANRDMGWYTAYRIAVLKERGYVFEQLPTGALKVCKAIIAVAEPEQVGAL